MVLRIAGSKNSSDKIRTMLFRYFVLALVMLYNQDIVCSHILTSIDLPIPSCMKMLSLAVHELCEMYGESSSEESVEFPILPQLMERRYNIKQYILKRCCSQPCSMPELLLAC